MQESPSGPNTRLCGTRSSSSDLLPISAAAPTLGNAPDAVAGPLAMESALRRSQWDDLRRIAHQVKGAAGSYGYPSLAAAAKTMEDDARQGHQAAAANTIATLARLCRAAARGWEQQPPLSAAGITATSDPLLLPTPTASPAR